MSTAVGSPFDLGCRVSCRIFVFYTCIFWGLERLAVMDNTAVSFVGYEKVHSGFERGLGKKRRHLHSLKGPVQLSGLKLCACIKVNIFLEISLQKCHCWIPQLSWGGRCSFHLALKHWFDSGHWRAAVLLLQWGSSMADLRCSLTVCKIAFRYKELWGLNQRPRVRKEE